MMKARDDKSECISAAERTYTLSYSETMKMTRLREWNKGQIDVFRGAGLHEDVLPYAGRVFAFLADELETIPTLSQFLMFWRGAHRQQYWN